MKNTLSLDEVVASAKYIQSLEMSKKSALCDRIYNEQPILLGGVLVLNRMQIPMEKIEVVLHILLVLYYSFSKKYQLKPVTEEIYEQETEKFSSMIKYYDGESKTEKDRFNVQTIGSHPEKNALAFIFGYMQDHNMKNTDPYSQDCMRAIMIVFNCMVRARLNK